MGIGKTGKISVIPKDFNSAFPTMEKSLREKGFSRMPGTMRMLLPYKELNGRYRTGLDELATSVLKIEDPKERQLEQERVKKTRQDLELKTGISLSPTSKYYDYTSKDIHHVEMVRLQDGDNIFNLDDPWQAITYYWLKADPRIASSLQDYQAGKYPSDTQFYINDDDIESELQYKKKKSSNDAIIKFDSWSLQKRKKVARLLDLPVTDETKEEVVYNMVDTFLKAEKVKGGSFDGRDPIKVFTVYADLKDEVLYVKDLVQQAFKHNIYKEKKGGRVYEGELELFKDKEDMIEFYLDDRNQEDLLELEKKLKLKKVAEI